MVLNYVMFLDILQAKTLIPVINNTRKQLRTSTSNQRQY